MQYVRAGCRSSRRNSGSRRLRGIHSHGVLRVPEYVRHLTTGGVNPAGRPFVASIHGSAIVVDGGNSMGQIGGTYAMREVIKTGRSTGVAFAAVRGSNHCGAMEWYTLLATEENMIGVAGTNALPTMAPWGSLDKIVGFNPLSDRAAQGCRPWYGRGNPLYPRA